jgi:hypothetical protein
VGLQIHRLRSQAAELPWFLPQELARLAGLVQPLADSFPPQRAPREWALQALQTWEGRT